MHRTMISVFSTAIFVMAAFQAQAMMLPDYSGNPVKRATAELTKKGLKVRVEPGSPAGSLKEIGSVEKMSPTGNVPAGREIVLRAYQAGRPVPMMNFTGNTLEKTRQFLEERGVPFSVVSEISSCPEGTIGSHTPQRGEMYTPGGNVILKVCTKGVQVPNFIGRTHYSITRHDERDLKIRRTGESRPSSKVVRQNPAAGSMVAKGSTIHLEFAP